MSVIKYKDTDVLTFDIDNGIYIIHNEKLLPYRLKNRITNTEDGNIPIPKLNRNFAAISSYFANRVLNISRTHAKAILNKLGIEQLSDTDTNLKIAIMCHSLSVTDDYWLTNNSNDKWDDFNLYKNHLSKVIENIALTGYSPLTLERELRTPELTGMGAYAKAWKREEDGLYLYKASTKGGNESKIEVAVSKLLDCTNVEHVIYTDAGKSDDRYVCKCKSMKKDGKNIVPASDIIAWCNASNISFDNLVRKIDADGFYKMLIVDYLVANTDRHSGNWGFYADDEMNLISLHPLFDHNNAFDEKAIKNRSHESLTIPGKSLEEAALYAASRCNIEFKENIPIEIFPSVQAYTEFNRRKAQIEQIQKKNIDNEIEEFSHKNNIKTDEINNILY